MKKVRDERWMLVLIGAAMIGIFALLAAGPQAPKPLVAPTGSGPVPRQTRSTVPAGVARGYCEPDPKLFSNIKRYSGASQSAELDDKKLLGLFSASAFRAERERSWKNPDPGVINPRPHPPYAPNLIEIKVEPGERFLEDRNGEVRECKLLPYSFGYKVYDLDGRLMGLTETASYTWYEYPERF